VSGTQPARSDKTQQARKNGSRQGDSSGARRSGTQRVREQQRAREQQADQARQKVEQRRSKQSGVAGWVSDRASQWSLEGLDWDFFELQKYFWNPLMDYWFRMEIEGWEQLPEPPALLIGIHSGAPFVWDAWTIGVQWWRHFGRDRPLHGTAHDALMASPLIGSYFRRMGVLPAAADSISAALAAGEDVALWPGGEKDSLRPWTKRDEAILAGRMGFVRLAIRSQVPIVPISTVGGPDSMPVLATGRRLAKVFQLDKVARLKMFPIALQVPWGISPALLPEIPLPTKIRTAFQEPIRLTDDPERADDSKYVEGIYDEVRASIQSGMDELARRRRLPLFG
jgi:1-acyl-sn-glycerol-3-phosphate acyltransferase